MKKWEKLTRGKKNMKLENGKLGDVRIENGKNKVEVENDQENEKTKKIYRT